MKTSVSHHNKLNTLQSSRTLTTGIRSWCEDHVSTSSSSSQNRSLLCINVHYSFYFNRSSGAHGGTMLPSRRHTQSVCRWLRCKQRRAACDSSTFSPPDHISSLSHCTREAWHRVYPMSDRSEPQQQRLCTSQPITAPRHHRVTLCNSVCVSVPGQHTVAAPCPVSTRWGHSVITFNGCPRWISSQNIQTVPLKMARGTVKAHLEESGRRVVHGRNRSACIRHEGLSDQRRQVI